MAMAWLLVSLMRIVFLVFCFFIYFSLLVIRNIVNMRYWKSESALEPTIPAEITSTAANSTDGGREIAITESKVDFGTSHPSQHTPNQGTDDTEPQKRLAEREEDWNQEVVNHEQLQASVFNIVRNLVDIHESLPPFEGDISDALKQRDALKQALAEMTDELASAMISHQKELEIKDAVLHETSQKLAAAMDQVDSLEKQLAELKTSVSVAKQPSFVEKVSEMERVLAEMQLKVDLAEAEAESSRKVVDVTSTELEKCQKTVHALGAQVTSVTQEKHDLLEQLERLKTKHMNDVEEYANERTQLESGIGDLENVIACQKEDMESLMRKFEELNDLYNSLSARSMEDATETTSLQDEINSLHKHIAELKLSMEMEAAARQKLEADSDAVVACIQEVTQEGWGDKTVSLSESNFASSEPTSLLEERSNLLIAKYKAFVQEVEAKTLSEQESLSQMQQMLESKDLELSELSKRMEDAATHMAQQEDVVQGLMQQVNKLRRELAKANGERDALRNELVLAEQRTANTRGKLSLAVKKGKDVVQQRDSLKKSYSEQDVLLAKCKEELASKESMVSRIKDEWMTSNRKVKDLEANVESLMRRKSVLERDMLDKKNLLQALETRLGKYSSRNEWSAEIDWVTNPIFEMSNIEKRSIPSNSAGTSKSASFDVAIDMDVGASRLLEVSDEKGHGFKFLARAWFMPRGTRFVADRIDRICSHLIMKLNLIVDT